MPLVIDRRPMSRGVEQLMYVGDDEAVETALLGKPTGKELAVGAVAAVVALQSKGVTRLVAAGIASWVGYRAYRARLSP